MDTNLCLMFRGPAADPIVITQPESKFATNDEYRCRRCGESFSSPHLTVDVIDGCPFDREAT